MQKLLNAAKFQSDYTLAIISPKQQHKHRSSRSRARLVSSCHEASTQLSFIRSAQFNRSSPAEQTRSRSPTDFTRCSSHSPLTVILLVDSSRFSSSLIVLRVGLNWVCSQTKNRNVRPENHRIIRGGRCLRNRLQCAKGELAKIRDLGVCLWESENLKLKKIRDRNVLESIGVFVETQRADLKVVFETGFTLILTQGTSCFWGGGYMQVVLCLISLNACDSASITKINSMINTLKDWGII